MLGHRWTWINYVGLSIVIWSVLRFTYLLVTRLRARAQARAAAEPMVLFVQYPAENGTRDRLEEALLRDENSHRWICDGGGTLVSGDGAPLSVTDVTLFAPERENYEAFLAHLRQLNMPPETRVKSRFGDVLLHASS